MPDKYLLEIKLRRDEMKSFAESLLCMKDSQSITATHSPVIRACPDAALYPSGEEWMHAVESAEAVHYLAVEGFKNNH